MNRPAVFFLSSQRNMFKMSNRTYKVLTFVTVPEVRRSKASMGMTSFSTSAINMSKSPEELKELIILIKFGIAPWYLVIHTYK